MAKRRKKDEPKSRTRRPWGGSVFVRKDRPGTLWIKFVDPTTGKRRQVLGAETTDDAGWEAAERKLAEVTGKAAADVERGFTVVPVREFMETYRPILVARACPRHATISEAQIERFAAALGNPAMHAVTAADAADYVAALGRAGCGGATIRRHVAALSAFWGAAIERRAAVVNVWRGLRLPKVHQASIRFRSEAEVRRMIERCPARIRPLFAFIAATGTRYSEAASLQWSAVAPDLSHVSLVRTKSGRVRHVPLVGEAQEIVRNLRAARVAPKDGAADCVFALRPATEKRPARPYSHGYAFKILSKALDDANIPSDRPFHSLRNSLASRMVLRGVPLSVVAHAIGDTLQVTASRYGHLTPDDEVARAYRAMAQTASADVRPRARRRSKPVPAESAG